MSKSVTIPSSDQEMWVCRINHKEYSYPQGTTQTVPDEVAELIASINANAVQATPEEQATWEVYSQGGWIPMQGGDSLPDTTSASAGDVLSLDEDKEPVWSAPSGGGGGFTEVYIDMENPISTDTFDAYPLKRKSDNTPVITDDIIESPLSYYLISADVSGSSIFVPCLYIEASGMVEFASLSSGTSEIDLQILPPTGTNNLYKIEMK